VVRRLNAAGNFTGTPAVARQSLVLGMDDWVTGVDAGASMGASNGRCVSDFPIRSNSPHFILDNRTNSLIYYTFATPKFGT